MKLKPVIYTIVNLVIAIWVLRLLQTGGWLTHHYEWNDPNAINFLLMLLEPVVVLFVIAYWIWRTPGLCRVLFISFVVQLLVAAGFLAFFAHVGGFLAGMGLIGFFKRADVHFFSPERHRAWGRPD